MALTPGGRALTQAHGRAQIALRARTVASTLLVARGLNLEDVDGSWVAVEPSLMALASEQRRLSSGLSGAYLQRYRAAEGVAGALRVVSGAAVDADALRTSLRVCGPYTANRLLAQRAPNVAAVVATRLVGVMSRTVLDGGRATIQGTVHADPRALGWGRSTSGRACYFCAMLASRGPVYKSEDTGGFQAHDHCACGLEPVYHEAAAWAPGAQAYASAWQDATHGLSGDDAIRAFREALA